SCRTKQDRFGLSDESECLPPTRTEPALSDQAKRGSRMGSSPVKRDQVPLESPCPTANTASTAIRTAEVNARSLPQKNPSAKIRSAQDRFRWRPLTLSRVAPSVELC